MTKKVLVLGARGWLGGEFVRHLMSLGVDVWFDDRDILEGIGIPDGVSVVVNFAAKANIDWCEKNREKAFRNNVLGAYWMALWCAKYHLKYVFASSACIFRSQTVNDIQYEDAKPHPGCFYTETKLMAERLIREVCPDALIARWRFPISEIPHPRNVLNKLMTYEKLIDTQESVVVVEDFIPRLWTLIDQGRSGDFHLINAGTISPAEIGRELGHTFSIIGKPEFDAQIAAEHRAHRVTTVVGTKYSYLPPIRERIRSVAANWKAASQGVDNA